MSGDTEGIKAEAVDTALDSMKLEEEVSSAEANRDGTVISIHNGHPRSPSHTPKRSSTSSPLKSLSTSVTPKVEDEHEEVVTADITISVETGKAPKLSRKASQKLISRPPRVFSDLPDATSEAKQTFQVIKDCIYGSKYMGSSEHEALGCDCSEEWRDGANHACGEDSDCINRATKIECIGEECCGAGCQNQRFQRKQWAQVSVIKTEKKGYGLRTDSDLQANDFIFEYVGEVINEPTFRRRTLQYDDEGIKHFYFMSLTKSEFVDATRKGNLGRFCNHSCNPNCYVDKWVVGEKLRMGIFAERNIKAGEELVFNYNVDRYGADPQPCYCDEPNCTGFIGGKTQTERATKLSHATIEALGIDDGDGWDTAVAKRPRKKKTGEDDEEYVNNIQPKGLNEDGVTNVMATLMQCKEKWIAVKLLSRIQRCDDDRVRNRVARMHGYQILRTAITTFLEDHNVILQVLDILYKFPRLTRNKIVDSKIEPTIESLTTSEHEGIAQQSKQLLEEWSKLEVAYRIPRKKFDPNAQQTNTFDRRGGEREEEPSNSPAPIVAPTGPKNAAPQRYAPSRPLGPSRPPMIRRPFQPLPPGWYSTTDKDGHVYYYNKSGETTWKRPTVPAIEPQLPKVNKAASSQKALQDIIDSLTKQDQNAQVRHSETPQPVESTPKEKKPEKWRSLSQEKQMKLYENTLFPHIKYVMDRFHKKLPKEDLKKFAKEIGKKLVASDFKNNRVEDPTRISSKHEKKVKKYVKEFFEKAVAKKAEHDKKRAEKKTQAEINGQSSISPLNGDTTESVSAADPEAGLDVKGEESDSLEMLDDDADEDAGPASPALDTPTDENLKRKREDGLTPLNTPTKRLKDENDNGEDEPSPPPPPPPPPQEDFQSQMEVDERTSEERDLARQEEDLMRENEEALIKENEEALRDAEAAKIKTEAPIPGSIDDVDEKVNGLKQEEIKDEDEAMIDLGSKLNGQQEDEKMDDLPQHEPEQVLSH